MSRKVLLIFELPEEPFSALRHYAQQIEQWKGQSKRELIDALQGKDAILCTPSEIVNREVMEACPELKMISNFSVGYDHVDIQAATEKGIVVTHTPDVLTSATADLAWALLFSVARRIVEGDRFVRSGQWNGWGAQLLLGREITGKTLGIVGMGRIGQAVALRARGFQMPVIYYSRTRLPFTEEKKLQVEYRDLDSLLQESDYVSLHTPYTKETHHLIGERELAQMKTTAYLINTARGKVVDEKALIHALQEDQIAGAGLDVYAEEPHVPEELKRMENVVLAPHIGSSTHETRAAMADLVVENLLSFYRGEKPAHLVNPEVW